MRVSVRVGVSGAPPGGVLFLSLSLSLLPFRGPRDPSVSGSTGQVCVCVFACMCVCVCMCVYTYVNVYCRVGVG